MAGAAGEPLTREPRAALEAVWRIEGGRVVASLAAMTGDVSAAEDLAQDALAEALASWPEAGVPRNPAAWLTAVGKRRAVDGWRRGERLGERYAAIAADLERTVPDDDPGTIVADREPIDDDLLRLVFTACHPVLRREAQIALTLRTVGGLTSEAIARMFLVPVPTMQARITRAKKTLTDAGVPFAAPDPAEWSARLGGVLRVINLIFTEGYAPTSGSGVVDAATAGEALRLGRMLAALIPDEPEVHGLVATMEFQSSRFAARTATDGTAVRLADQDRTRWDHSAITRGRRALAAADAAVGRTPGRRRGVYALQAAIACEHARAPSHRDTDWAAIIAHYDDLAALTGSPVVALNRAAALSMTAGGPDAALSALEPLADDERLAGSHLLPSVRGELLLRVGRIAEGRTTLRAAADATANDAQRALLAGRADPRIRLVVSDMDGTLLDGDGAVPADFWPLLDEMTARGIAFVPASGRQYQSLLRLFREAADLSYVGDNGAVTVHDGRFHTAGALDPAFVRRVIAAVRAANDDGRRLRLIACRPTGAVIESHDAAFTVKARTYCAAVDEVDDLTAAADGVVKIAVYDFDDAASSAAGPLAPFAAGHELVVSGTHWVDITPRGVHKGVGVRRLQEILGVRPDETVVFGDYLNDLGMLDAADWSFAMDNAHPEVAARARHRAPSNTEHGVVTVLRELLA